MDHTETTIPGGIKARIEAHRTNVTVLASLRAQRQGFQITTDVDTIAWASLHTHPAVGERLWSIAAALPDGPRTRAAVYGFPVLFNPHSGLIFALAYGSSFMAMRLPENERQAVLLAQMQRARSCGLDSPFQPVAIAALGADWVTMPDLYDDTVLAWAQAAYHAAR